MPDGNERAGQKNAVDLALVERQTEQQLVCPPEDQALHELLCCRRPVQPDSIQQISTAGPAALAATADGQALEPSLLPLERPAQKLPQLYLRLIHQTQEYYRLIFAMRRLDHAQDLLFAVMATFIVMIMCLQTMQHFAEATQAQLIVDMMRNMMSNPTLSAADALSDLRGMLFLLYTMSFVFPMIYMLSQNSSASLTQSMFTASHLCLSDAGISTMRIMVFGFQRKPHPWNTVRSVKYVKPLSKRCAARIQIEFTGGLPIKINLHRFTSEQEMRVLLSACKHYRPDLGGQIEELEQALLPEAEKTYTELWSKSLLHENERLRLTALPPDTSLQNGRFRIINQLGSGGQGTAYLAEDLTEGTLIVLKEYILPDSRNVHDRRRAITRLEDEAQLLGKLQHEQIVKALDVFLEDHRAYLMLEHIDGPPLKSLVADRGRLPEDEVIGLALQMCEVLQYLHGQSPPMVHQDFTPDNLLLTESHVLKLVDFNVAKEKENSKTSLVVGKHAYMPPEQFRGKACTQSDIYALGATLCFLLTGLDPEPLTACHPAESAPVSAALDLVIARATALELGDRYQDISDLKRDLELMPEKGA